MANHQMKDWEIIADNLSKAGWSWGCVSAIDSEGRTIWIADAHRGDGKRFVVRADEKLSAFMELESSVQQSAMDQRHSFTSCPASTTSSVALLPQASSRKQPERDDLPSVGL